jgi:DNA-binding MarR family transcriptional regulator
MEDLRTILSSHNSKTGKSTSDAINTTDDEKKATTSEIPDLFFDEILVVYKMTRVEILLLMYLYRATWCKPNLYNKYGIAPMIFHSDIASQLDVTMEALHQTLRRLEGFGFIETIRSGQYFVRKYFTEENDRMYGQTYDNFL